MEQLRRKGRSRRDNQKPQDCNISFVDRSRFGHGAYGVREFGYI
jgi:hypothetical protein